MNEGKQKGFFAGMAILQIIGNIFCWFNINNYAKDYLKILKADLEAMGPEIVFELEKVFTLDFATVSILPFHSLCI